MLPRRPTRPRRPLLATRKSARLSKCKVNNKSLNEYLVALKKAQCLTLKAAGWDLKKTQIKKTNLLLFGSSLLGSNLLFRGSLFSGRLLCCGLLGSLLCCGLFGSLQQKMLKLLLQKNLKCFLEIYNNSSNSL